MWNLSVESRRSNIRKLSNVTLHINRMNNKKTPTRSTDAEKSFDKIQHIFIIKKNKLGIEGNYCNIIKPIHEKPIANITIFKDD